MAVTQGLQSLFTMLCQAYQNRIGQTLTGANVDIRRVYSVSLQTPIINALGT